MVANQMIGITVVIQSLNKKPVLIIRHHELLIMILRVISNRKLLSGLWNHHISMKNMTIILPRNHTLPTWACEVSFNMLIAAVELVRLSNVKLIGVTVFRFDKFVKLGIFLLVLR